MQVGRQTSRKANNQPSKQSNKQSANPNQPISQTTKQTTMYKRINSRLTEMHVDILPEFTHCSASSDSHPPNPSASPTTKERSMSSLIDTLFRMICKLSKGFPIRNTTKRLMRTTTGLFVCLGAAYICEPGQQK